jgi:hypothetical protein
VEVVSKDELIDFKAEPGVQFEYQAPRNSKEAAEIEIVRHYLEKGLTLHQL